jgi:hypothetical protein
MLEKLGLTPIEFKVLDTGGKVQSNQLDVAIFGANSVGIVKPESLDAVARKFHHSTKYYFLSEKALNEEIRKRPDETQHVPALTSEQRELLRAEMNRALFGPVLEDGKRGEGLYDYLTGLIKGGPARQKPKPVLEYRGKYSTGRN